MLEFNLDGSLVNPFESTVFNVFDDFEQNHSLKRTTGGLNTSPSLMPLNNAADPDLTHCLDKQSPISHWNSDSGSGSHSDQDQMAEVFHYDQTRSLTGNRNRLDKSSHDPLTGKVAQDESGYIPFSSTSLDSIAIPSSEVISSLAEKLEVNNLLAEDRFDRDQISGTTTFYNFTFNNDASANEHSSYGRTDSKHNAANIGTVAYRDDKEVIGTVGYTSNGRRDSNDYFSFYAGKSGTYDLSLTNLTANVGLALYNDSGSLLSWSNQSGTQDENLSTFLNEGWYTSRIYSYNTSASNNNGATGFNLNISKQAGIFEQTIVDHIVDRSVENAALNSIKYDNTFDRNDMIGILKSAGDYGSVSGTEITDLRQFHNMFSGTMRADIAGLSRKVVFGDDSNAWYTGFDSIRDNLGNLEAGSSTQNLNLLIGKHMLGTDRPMIHTGSYTEAGGSLFVEGIEANDIDQGNTGSCYFLSALASTANEKQSIIRNMFNDNGDGTYSVRFFTNGQADYVTVDNMMATKADGTYLHADAGDGTATDALVADNNELWVALAEKAYAQLNESGRLGQQEATNRYGEGNQRADGISWGSTTNAITHITGLSSSGGIARNSGAVDAFGVDGVSSNELRNLVNGDNVVCAAWSGHARTIVSYDALTGNYAIRNPYDRNHSSLTHAQLVALGATISWSTT